MQLNIPYSRDGQWASNINKNEKCWKFYLENFTHFLWKYVMKLVLLKLKLCRYVGCFNRADGWFLMVSLGGSGNGDGDRIGDGGGGD